MTERDRFQRVSDVFERVRALSPGDRTAVLDELCAVDSDLRSEVEELLAHHDDPVVDLENPAVEIPPELIQQLDASAMPASIGRYRILRILGEGGMGVVYLAEQQNPKREVALKVMRAAVTSQAALRRFAHEAQILGRLQHPGIAQIYEAGTAAVEGAAQRPFFAMEYVRGETLTSCVQHQAMGTRQRLKLFAQICDAVEHAHQKGVVHRDLKPGNILVTAEGEPKILDFGVARATDSDIQVTTMRTDVGQLIGTLPYMSPEQVTGDPLAVDTRSDVYALGVVLFELLSGRLPYDVGRRLIHEAARVIREQEPTRLSSVNRLFRGDLETIVGKALEKDRARRYQSVSELAADVRRYLTDQPIVARPPSATYQFRKFAKRNKLLVGSTAAVIAALVVAVTIVSFALMEARRANTSAMGRLNESLRQTEMANSVNTFLQKMLESVNPFDQGADVSVRDVLDQAVIQLEAEEATLEPEVAAALRYTIGNTYRSLGLLPESMRHLQKAVSLRRSIDREDESAQLDLANALDSLGEAWRDMAKPDEAEPLSREALAIRRSVIQPDDATIADNINNLGLILKERGDYDGAEMMYREALTIKRAVLPPNDDRLTNTLMNLGLLLYYARSDFDGALTMINEAIDVIRASHPGDYPGTAHCLTAKATIVGDQGFMEQAIELNLEALEMRRRLFAGDHLDTALSLNNIAILYKRQGDFEQAEAAYVEAMEMRRRLFGDRHPAVAQVMANLSTMYYGLGQFEKAEPLARDALEFRREGYGETHPETAFSWNTLGVVCMGLKKYDESQQCFLNAIAARTASISADHRDNGPVHLNLARLYIRIDQPSDAEAQIRRAIAIEQMYTDDAQPRMLDYRLVLAALLVSSDRFSEAEAELRRSLDALAAAGVSPMPQVQDAQSILAVSLHGQGRVDEAESAITQLLESFREQESEDSSRQAFAECVHGVCLVDQGNAAEGKALLESAQARLGDDPSDGWRLKWIEGQMQRLAQHD